MKSRNLWVQVLSVKGMLCLVLWKIPFYSSFCYFFFYIEGVSPEFELALYTLAFFTGDRENEVTLDTGRESFDLNVICHKYDGDKVGSTFVEALAHYD